MTPESSMQAVLVATDDSGARAVAEAVARRRGSTVLCADQEGQVWGLLTAHKPRIMLLDMSMAEGAAEICEDVRADSSLESTVIVLLAPKGAADGIQRGMDSGADYFLTLPLDDGDLEDVVSLAFIE
ncbi:MAG: response regulator [Candidatus Latescibacteria bacterium]|jgi:sigma-B regulation protein RsbU (phosphoserine phosphatase)|nr:response regulator [Candidatus Latescibacterota bacterium]